MSFMQKVLKQNIPIWEKCSATRFVRKLRIGTLPFDLFKEFMIQDSIYLKQYACVYGKAIYHATTLRDIQLYYSMLNFVTDTESTVRLNYLERFGMTDDDIERIAPLPETQKYVDFLFAVAERGDEREILMAVLPCMVSYSYIFRKVAARPESQKSRYWDFIQDYADNAYAENCGKWCAFADRKCNDASAARKEELAAIFEKASLLELDFWNMTYRRKQ